MGAEMMVTQLFATKQLETLTRQQQRKMEQKYKKKWSHCKNKLIKVIYRYVLTIRQLPPLEFFAC